jgi:hypothetical protein
MKGYMTIDPKQDVVINERLHDIDPKQDVVRC